MESASQQRVGALEQVVANWISYCSYISAPYMLFGSIAITYGVIIEGTTTLKRYPLPLSYKERVYTYIYV